MQRRAWVVDDRRAIKVTMRTETPLNISKRYLCVAVLVNVFSLYLSLCVKNKCCFHNKKLKHWNKGISMKTDSSVRIKLNILFRSQTKMDVLSMMIRSDTFLPKCVITKGNWNVICMNLDFVLKALGRQFIFTRYPDIDMILLPWISNFLNKNLELHNLNCFIISSM